MAAIVDEQGCIRRALILMMMSDGDLDPDELVTVLGVYEKVTGSKLLEADVRAEAAAVVAAGDELGKCRGLGDSLDEPGKLRVLGAAFAVAAADGFVVEEEDEQLGRLASDLGLTPERYRAAIEQLLSAGHLPD
jgi:tellurite resistance protein